MHLGVFLLKWTRICKQRNFSISKNLKSYFGINNLYLCLPKLVISFMHRKYEKEFYFTNHEQNPIEKWVTVLKTKEDNFLMFCSKLTFVTSLLKHFFQKKKKNKNSIYRKCKLSSLKFFWLLRIFKIISKLLSCSWL